ncbi:hypothetical protein EYF80_020401 [Liparis tanakae]|uniref:Uncharacterized protein n=1 Tax=Liparis tanakae TaxID=230148 RepID=A0A4Z2HUU4_9TELE|nr:hypothetical protein EYF80_020401 [Liparis tanakae]
MPSISSRWHSILSRSRGLDSSSHLWLQQWQSDVGQQQGQVMLSHVGVVADPRQQRGYQGLLVGHVDVIRRDQPLHLVHREQQELLASHHL